MRLCPWILVHIFKSLKHVLFYVFCLFSFCCTFYTSLDNKFEVQLQHVSKLQALPSLKYYLNSSLKYYTTGSTES